VMRGGSFDGGTAYAMPSVMVPNPAGRRAGSVGFRVICAAR
jgi:formylglycine-generating enzyme required for sulfatase activity